MPQKLWLYESMASTGGPPTVARSTTKGFRKQGAARSGRSGASNSAAASRSTTSVNSPSAQQAGRLLDG